MKWKFNRTYQVDSDIALPKLLNAGIKFDLILTDPPYNLNKDFGNKSDKLPLKEFLEVTRKRIALCKKLLSTCGSIVWFGIHHYIGYIQVIMYESGLYYRRLNIWHYENGFSRSKKTPMTQYEPFLWFSKSNKEWTYNVDDVRVPYKSRERLKNPIYYTDSRGKKQRWMPNQSGAMRGDVWKFPTLAGKIYESEKTEHPTQKPETLFTGLVKAFCPKNESGQYGGRILDPFHGSGTLGVCCEKLNLQGHNIEWMGFEIERRWVRIGNKRIRDINLLKSSTRK